MPLDASMYDGGAAAMGTVVPIGANAAQAAGGHPATNAEVADDPHDKSDRGPMDLLEDPVIWLVGLAAIATGVLSVRFRGEKVTDAVMALAVTTLYSIVGIVTFKVFVSKVEIPGLQKVAAAI